MATMRAVQVSRPGGPFEMVERPIPEPGAGAVASGDRLANPPVARPDHPNIKRNCSTSNTSARDPAARSTRFTAQSPSSACREDWHDS